MKKKRIAIYARVSTDDQTNENQIADLTKWAEFAGHEIVETYSDKMSGAKQTRPGFQRMMTAATRREFDMVAVWALDRLGRSLHQVSATINQLVELDIALFAHKQGIDSTTSTGRAMLGMCAVFAELEREFIRERTKAGLRRAKREGVKLGRPRISTTVEGKRIDKRNSPFPIKFHHEDLPD